MWWGHWRAVLSCHVRPVTYIWNESIHCLRWHRSGSLRILYTHTIGFFWKSIFVAFVFALVILRHSFCVIVEMSCGKLDSVPYVLRSLHRYNTIYRELEYHYNFPRMNELYHPRHLPRSLHRNFVHLHSGTVSYGDELKEQMMRTQAIRSRISFKFLSFPFLCRNRRWIFKVKEKTRRPAGNFCGPANSIYILTT